MGRKGRGYFGSTEPQARKVLAGMKGKPTPRPAAVDTGGKTTATTPKNMQKTPAQGQAEKEALRKKQDAEFAAAREAKRRRRRTQRPVGLRVKN